MIVNIIIITLLVSILVLLILKPNHKPTSKTVPKNAVILDSCALIDGRVIELAKVGFMPKLIIVPQFIVKELQLLADGRDSYKRERARFGLNVVQQLQADSALSVIIDETVPDKPTTDEQLVELAKRTSAELFTTDFNLNQVATIEGVTVLNVNELAHALRPVALPGESVYVSILQSGSNRDQGVGYLDDGTMVVVDGAIKDIGKSIEVIINKSHQTVAGKMLFAKKVATASSETRTQSIQAQRNTQKPSNTKRRQPKFRTRKVDSKDK